MLLISDANIFIDFDCCGLIAELCALPDTIAVPDILFIEELEEQHSDLLDLGVIMMELSEQSVQYAEQLHIAHQELSINDLLALSLAREQSCPLVTGDSNLRKVAQLEKVIIKGSLWLMQRMIEERIVTIEVAEEAFKTMRINKRRLPWVDVRKMLEQIKN